MRGFKDQLHWTDGECVGKMTLGDFGCSLFAMMVCVCMYLCVMRVKATDVRNEFN